MKRNWIRKAFKITGVIFMALIAIVGYLTYRFTNPDTDQEIKDQFEGEAHKPYISYENFKGIQVRVISMQEHLDEELPTLVLVHGSPGSAMDFKKYLKSEALNKIANIMTYDRIGYGQNNTGEVLPSITEEVELLHHVMRNLDEKKIVLAGYSYGGTVIMASTGTFKKKIALAASVRGDLEPMFWVLNLYKYGLSRSLMPNVFKAASSEKLRHVEELPAYEHQWNVSKSQVLSIHGKRDRIVPYENSLFLQSLFDPQKFSLITLEKGNHTLIWTNFDLIEAALVKSLEE